MGRRPGRGCGPGWERAGAGDRAGNGSAPRGSAVGAAPTPSSVAPPASLPSGSAFALRAGKLPRKKKKKRGGKKKGGRDRGEGTAPAFRGRRKDGTKGSGGKKVPPTAREKCLRSSKLPSG